MTPVRMDASAANASHGRFAGDPVFGRTAFGELSAVPGTGAPWGAPRMGLSTTVLAGPHGGVSLGTHGGFGTHGTESAGVEGGWGTHGTESAVVRGGFGTHDTVSLGTHSCCGVRHPVCAGFVCAIPWLVS